MSKELIISQKEIESRIFVFRDSQVMLDRDLAEMYQVETKVLNQAVKRNIERFPEAFRFQLTEDEINELVTNSDRFGFYGSQNTTSSSRSQFVTLNKSGSKRGQNIKYLPFAFTEQGVAMLSAVLRSDVAVKVSIQIINAFVEMRKLIANHSGLLQRMTVLNANNWKPSKNLRKYLKLSKAKTSFPTKVCFLTVKYLMLTNWLPKSFALPKKTLY